MSFQSHFHRYARSFRRGLHVLAAPVKGDSGRGGLFIQAYRGFGSRNRLFLMGRVFRQPGFGASLREDRLRRDLIDLVRRLLRKPITGARVRVRYKDTDTIVETDRHGFFRVDMELGSMPSDVSWHEMELSLDKPSDDRASTSGEFFTPLSHARYGVISDIDDTVVYTGVANTAMMMWRLFAQGAESRVVFPGVPALYQAFHQGCEGREGNPLFYVSRGPWSIYEVLVEVFRRNRIPHGPILILREWGMKRGSLMPRRAKDHKLDSIRHLLEMYQDMRFVLVGDSGQRDPEIYSDVLREYPDRILGIYIRDVSNTPERSEAIAELAREARETGCDLILAADNVAMAEHAADQGLIDPGAVDAVREEQRRSGQEDD
ncbi:Phosphatidate phosphatase APP1 [Marinobacter daqiaonensis]|uniref:Phosphatidate phosphatase APP1 n=1 Tax=Marinobacter daqiaonensis TaxID=650891 RepID=A0A1I6JNV7_9GAMM|nr:phosphatase domain-containing protein [Marinobacter daqiaonensis]SFR80648.1 Phosphatidate phosphatase APP1 [Marinobacter daqiaonensis]